MKSILLLAVLLFNGCAGVPIKGKVCYTDAVGNQICVGGDGKSIVIDGSFRAQK